MPFIVYLPKKLLTFGSFGFGVKPKNTCPILSKYYIKSENKYWMQNTESEPVDRNRNNPKLILDFQKTSSSSEALNVLNLKPLCERHKFYWCDFILTHCTMKEIYINLKISVDIFMTIIHQRHKARSIKFLFVKQTGACKNPVVFSLPSGIIVILNMLTFSYLSFNFHIFIFQTFNKFLIYLLCN